MKKKQLHNRKESVIDMIAENQNIGKAFEKAMRHAEHVGSGVKMYREKKGVRTFVLENIPTQYLSHNGKYEAIKNEFLRIEDMPEELCIEDLQNEAKHDNKEEYVYYRNQANDFSVCLPSRLKKNLMSVRHRGNSFSIMLLDPHSETAQNLRKKLYSCYKNDTSCKARLEGREKNLLCYPFFQKGSDLVYELHHTGFLQKIVLYKKRAQYQFAFMLQMYEQVMLEQENGDFVICRKEITPINETAVGFRLLKPIVKDMLGETGCDVEFSLEQITDMPNRYLMKLKLDAEWLNSNERAFPVTLQMPFEKGKGLSHALPIAATQISTKKENCFGKYFVGQQGGNACSVCVRVQNPMHRIEIEKEGSKIEKVLLAWDIAQSKQGANYVIRTDNRAVDKFFDDGRKPAMVFDITYAVKEMIVRNKSFVEFLIEPVDKMQKTALELSGKAGALNCFVKMSAVRSKRLQAFWRKIRAKIQSKKDSCV